MDPSSIGPLLPGVGEPPRIPLGAALAAAGAGILALKSPNTFEKLSHLAIGVGVNPLKGTIKPSPLILTNLLPQPIGFIPPQWGNVKRNWWAPDAVLKDLPGWVIGSDEARRDEKNRIDAANWLHEQNQLDFWRERVKTFDDQKLNDFLPKLLEPDGNYAGRNPEGIAEIVRAEQKAREAAKQMAQQQQPGPLGSPVPTTAPSTTVPPALASAPVIGPTTPLPQPTLNPITDIGETLIGGPAAPRPGPRQQNFPNPTPNGPFPGEILLLLAQDP